MNKQFIEKTKEDLEEILIWARDPNRRQALECIYEIADDLLCEVKQYLEKEKDCLRNVGFGSCENYRHEDNLSHPVPETKGTLPPIDEKGDNDPFWETKEQ